MPAWRSLAAPHRRRLRAELEEGHKREEDGENAEEEEEVRPHLLEGLDAR